MRNITEVELALIADGAGILGTGGGGDPHLGHLLSREAVRRRGPVRLVTADELPDDARIVSVAGMGAPAVSNEKLPSLEGLLAAVRALDAVSGTSATYIVATEIGGINALLPFAVAAELGLAVVDADLMGRAFPQLQMAMPTLFGISAGPMAIADEKGNVAVVNTIDNMWMERFGRVLTVEMGAQSMLAFFSMSGAQLKESTVTGSITLSQNLGQALADARVQHQDPVGAVVDRLDGRLLMSGKVTGIDRSTEGGFTRLTAIVEGQVDGLPASLQIQSQNEHLVAMIDGQIQALTPDLIMVLDSGTGQPITTEALRFGLRVSVIATACDPRYRTPEGLDLVGPRAFGYDLDFVALDVLAARSTGLAV